MSTTADQDPDRVPQTLADKLNYLIEQYIKHAEQYAHQYPKWPTFEQLATQISETTGKSISHGYLHQLCRGKRDNPTLHHLQALAEFFGVPTAYFTDDQTTAEVMAQYELILAMKDSKVREICTYAPRLDPKGLEAITNLIKTLVESR